MAHVPMAGFAIGQGALVAENPVVEPRDDLLAPHAMSCATCIAWCLSLRATLVRQTLLEVAVEADAHQRRALQFERSVGVLGHPNADPDVAPSLIALYWGAALRWIAYGCQAKYGRHKEHEEHLGAYLGELADVGLALHWNSLDLTRQNALFGSGGSLPDLDQARAD